ncbi:MAG: hypothetical protein V7K29_12355 [Nostoc sp.]
MRLTFNQAQLSCRDTASARFSTETKNCVDAARLLYETLRERHRYWELI